MQLANPARCVWLILACGLTIKVDIILKPQTARILPSHFPSVAMFNGHPDYERLIQIADEALYIAKDEVETVLNSVKPVFRCARMQR